MAVEFELPVSQPSLAKRVYTHLKVYRAASADGPFEEVSTPSTRIPLTDDVSYVFVDRTGTEDHFYRSTLWNERTGRESDPGLAFQGQLDPALEVISIEQLRAIYLFGVKQSDDRGRPFPDAMYRWYIKAAVSWIEHHLSIPLRPETIEAERVDFYTEDFVKFQFFRTKRRPIIQVDAVRLVVPGTSTHRDYPPEWYKVDKDAGSVEIVPGPSAMALPYFNTGGLLMPTIWASTTRSIPHVLECDYVAGFPRGQVPHLIKHCVGMLAAMGPLNVAGDLIAGAGIASYSMSLDGLSQSVSTTSSATNAGYGSRIIQYWKDLKETLPKLRAQYEPIKIEAV